MKTKINGILTLLLVFMVQITFAQERTISGVVSDGMGPVADISVKVKGTTRGTVTDFDGNYAIKAKTGDTLEFTHVSYATVTKVVGASSKINVSVKESGETLTEVVISTGYLGAMNSSKVSSAIAVVDSKQIEQIPIASLDQLLQGAAAGVNVNAGSGQPGQSATILIRGLSSLNGDTEPLFLIDGVAVDQDNFRSLNSNDIESISVLKDAAATSIYGNRAAGGVVLVTTKRGKTNSPLKIQYRSLYGVSINAKPKFDVMSSAQFLNFQKYMLPGSQFGDSLSDSEITALSNSVNTDWTDVLMSMGKTVSHEINFTSGGKNTTSYTSFGYFNQEGTTLGSALERFSFRNNSTGKSNNEKFKYYTNLSMNYSVSNFVVDAARGDNTGGQLDNPFIVPYIGLPYLSPYNPDGSLNIVGTVGSQALNSDGSINVAGMNGFLNTPFIAMNTAQMNTDEEREIKIIGGAGADYNFIKNMTAGVSFGLDYSTFDNLTIVHPNSTRGLITPNTGSLNKGSQSEFTTTNAIFSTLAKINYTNTFFEKLSLSSTVFGEYVYTNIDVSGFTGYGLNPALVGSGNAITDGNVREGGVNNYIPGVSSLEQEVALASVFTTIDLDWDNKYGVTSSIRRDQTSRFPNNPTGTFWSVSGRWNIDKEDFMENVEWLDILKLRASYGTVGNQTVGSRYEGRQGVIAGNGYQLGNQLVLGTLRDTDNIKWETTTKFNTGFSFGLWNKRLTGEFDFYNDITSDLFNLKPLSLSGTGYAQVNGNAGTMKNTGVDLQLAYDLLKKSKTNNWSIRIHGNTNYNRNEITDMPGVGFTGNTLRNQEGRSARSWFMTRWAGVDPSNGQPLYLDIDGNITNVYRDSDAVYIDKNTLPTYTGGFGANVSYKGFQLTNSFSFVTDVWRQNSSLAIIEDAGLAGFANQSTTLLNAWTTPGQITGVPALSYGGLRARDGDRYIEDASFLRLRNVTLAYNFSPEILKKTKAFSGIRVYGQGTNLITWTKWRGVDPESNNSSGFFDYPIPRTYTFGIDLTF